MNTMYQKLMKNFNYSLKISEIFENLLDKEDEIKKLEHQYLDKYQWPTFLEESSLNFSLGLDFNNWSQGNENTYFCHWEGCFRDSETSDYFHITFESFKTIYQKTCILFDMFNLKKNDTICMFSPTIIQLPIVMSAAISNGIIFAPMSPENYKNDIEVKKYLKKFSIIPKLFITIDTFYNGREWMDCKDILDKTIHNMTEYDDVKIIVIRHGGPHPGVPPPSYVYIGRRPNYNVTCLINERRDFRWGELMKNIKIPLTFKIPINKVKPSDMVLFVDCTYINSIQFLILTFLHKILLKKNCPLNCLHFVGAPSDCLFFTTQIYALISINKPFLITECYINIKKNSERIKNIFIDYEPISAGIIYHTSLEKEIIELINSLQKVFITSSDETSGLDKMVNKIIYS
uniref:AMP-binding domain-containing protein n=1 Tax=Strongyloides stercoralis TaxID=6248 RepID=A0A0K0DVU8_STRER